MKYLAYGGVLALLLLVGVGILFAAFTIPESLETEDYRIYEEDGNCYLSSQKHSGTAFIETTSLEDSHLKIRFASVAEMQKSVFSNKTSGEIVKTVLYHEDLDEDENVKTIEICDLRKVYDIALPGSAEEMYVTFGFSQYTFAFMDYPMVGELVTSGKKAGYIENEYLKPLADPQAFATQRDKELVSVADIPEQGTKQIVLRTQNGNWEYTSLFYTVDGIHGSVYVIEDYSNGKLIGITLYGEDAGADYKCTLLGVHERPSKAYLASFGLKFRLDLWKPFAY